MLLGKKPWTDAADVNARKIWDIPKTKAARSQACRDTWVDFSKEFCDVLAQVFCPQDERLDADKLGTAIAPIPLIDECEDEPTGGKKQTRSSADGDAWTVADVRDEGDEWVVRAALQ